MTASLLRIFSPSIDRFKFLIARPGFFAAGQETENHVDNNNELPARTSDFQTVVGLPADRP